MVFKKEILLLLLRSFALLACVVTLGMLAIHSYFYITEADKFRSQFRETPMPDNYDYGFKKQYEPGINKLANGTEISHILFPNNDSQKVVFFLQDIHGNLGYAEQFFKVFEDYGVALFCYDYRGFGKSKGITTQQAFYDDAASMYQLLLKKYKPENIYVVGFKKGCSMAASLPMPSPNKIILVDPFFNLHHPKGLIEKKPWFWPSYKQFDFRTDLKTKASRVPIYIFEGSKDPTYGAGAKLAQSNPNVKEQIVIDGVEYVDIFTNQGFKQKMIDLLKN